MTDLVSILGGLSRQQDDMQRQFQVPAAVANYLQFFNEEIITFYSGTKIERRGIGSSFVLGDGSYAVLGTATPQPYLGDSRVAFATLLDQFTGSPFVTSGLKTIRDMILGSTSAIAPTAVLLGSGTYTWIGSIAALSGQSQSVIATRAGQGIQWGSFIVTVASANTVGGSYRELAISGGNIMTYDTFPVQTIGLQGSEIRFNAIFRIGS